MTTTALRFSFSWRQFFYGLAFGILAFSLCACQGGPKRHDNDRLAFRGSMSIGSSQTKGTIDKGTATEDSLSGRGMAVGVRGEVSQRVDYLENVEVGLRVGILGRDAHASPDGVDVDAEAGELSIVGVARFYQPLGEGSAFSLYGEGFGGYAHEFGTVRGGPIDVDGDGGGLLYGAGAGIDYNGLQLGLEWSQRDFDFGQGLDLRAEDVVLVIGGVIRF